MFAAASCRTRAAKCRKTLVAVFLVEGLASITIAFGLRAALPRLGLLVIPGLSALVLGMLIMRGWPGTAVWTPGLLTGINFLSSRATLILLSRS